MKKDHGAKLKSFCGLYCHSWCCPKKLVWKAHAGRFPSLFFLILRKCLWGYIRSLVWVLLGKSSLYKNEPVSDKHHTLGGKCYFSKIGFLCLLACSQNFLEFFQRSCSLLLCSCCIISQVIITVLTCWYVIVCAWDFEELWKLLSWW